MCKVRWVVSARAATTQPWNLLQKNVLDRQRWTNREELRVAIVIWIERTYHRRRRQRDLGRLTKPQPNTRGLDSADG